MKKILLAVVAFAALGTMTSCKKCSCTVKGSETDGDIKVRYEETLKIQKDKLPDGMTCKDYEDMMKKGFGDNDKATVKCH